jgi:hypothetical protein
VEDKTAGALERRPVDQPPEKGQNKSSLTMAIRAAVGRATSGRTFVLPS